ncbi:MAG: hypothetical protein NTV80_25965, partial [Verrucomicrobia bacterium]|nr:hypothetical protein [Verrucomicrobiota bacterium]
KGDRLLAYSAPEAARDHAVWQTLWLSKEDSAAFFKAMRNGLTQRYDVQPSLDSPGNFSLEAEGRHVRLMLNRAGLGVLLIEAATPAFAEAASRL